jgi:hypothetical protein
MPQPEITTIADIVRVHAGKRPESVALLFGAPLTKSAPANEPKPASRDASAC